MLTDRIRRKPGRPKSTRPGRVMVSVPAEIAPAVKEIARVYRESQSGQSQPARVKQSQVYEENGYWRWRIVDSRAREFVDGGNFSSQEDAANSLREALDALTTA